MKRRTFFKFGLTSAAIALLKSNRLHGQSNVIKNNNPDLIQKLPVVVSKDKSIPGVGASFVKILGFDSSVEPPNSWNSNISGG